MSLPTLSPDLQKKARDELNEYPETRLRYLEELRQRANQRPELNIATSNIDLIRFLRARKFNLDLAHKLIINHYESKQKYPDIFGIFSPSAEQRTFESGYNVAFPERDQMGRKILAVRPGIWNTKERDIMNLLRSDLIALEILAQDEETQINGIILIVDFRDFGAAHATATNPIVFKTFGNVMLNYYPIRIKGIHILDQPKIFTAIFAIVSQFMKEKLRERVHIHGKKIEGLHEYINKECLPVDYAGTAPATDIKNWVRYIMNAEEDLEHLWF